MILYLTYWFPRKHRAKIVGIFMVAIPVSTFLGSPVSGAILDVDGVMGLRGWQWLFILEAVPAVLLGLLVLFVLPDRPAVCQMAAAGAARMAGEPPARRTADRLPRAADPALGGADP